MMSVREWGKGQGLGRQRNWYPNVRLIARRKPSTPRVRGGTSLVSAPSRSAPELFTATGLSQRHARVLQEDRRSVKSLCGKGLRSGMASAFTVVDPNWS